MSQIYLKGFWHEIFDFRFFPESVSPGPLSIPLWSFQLFLKIRGDNREWMFIAVSTTPAIKFFPAVSLIPVINNQKAWNLSQVSTTPRKNCSAVSTSPEKNFLAVSTTPAIRESCLYINKIWKNLHFKIFSFIAGVVDTADKHLFAIFSANFWKKVETIHMGYSGARGTLIYEKNLKSKVSCQTPFKLCLTPN